MTGRQHIAYLLAALSGGRIGKLLWRKQFLTLDIKAMNQLPSLNIPFVPWTNAAARPSAVHYMLNEIVVNGRRNVLELGSGVSTLYMARILALHGGTLLTVDHDENWLRIVAGYLEQMGLPEGTVRFCHAPIKEYDAGRLGHLPWYDPTAVLAALGEASFDMMVVDGPEAWMKGARLARYPALPVLAGNLSDNAVVFLDDINRKGERRILKYWASQHSLNAFIRPEASMAILRKGSQPVYNII